MVLRQCLRLGFELGSAGLVSEHRSCRGAREEHPDVEGARRLEIRRDCRDDSLLLLADLLPVAGNGFDHQTKPDAVNVVVRTDAGGDRVVQMGKLLC